MRYYINLLLLSMFFAVSKNSAHAIINGYVVESEDFKSYVSIRTESPFPSHSGAEVNGCGGTLIAPRYVLTAFHCRGLFSNDKLGDGRVLVGVSIQKDGTFQRKIEVLRVHYPPMPLDRDRVDAAILVLRSDATLYGAKVADIFRESPPLGAHTVSVGLGQGLSGISLEGYGSEVASQRYCDSDRVDFDARHDFCVGVKGSAQRTGFGDSGGPLYLKHPSEKNDFKYVGIVKGGVKASTYGAEETEYIRYTNVAALTEWLESLGIMAD